MKSSRSTTTMNISLPVSQRRFVEKRVREGGYSSASEFFRELVRRAQEEPSGPSFSSRAQLERLVLEGLRSPATPWTEEDSKALRARIHRRAKARRK
jgi:antitoxin ParD1/3/4